MTRAPDRRWYRGGSGTKPDIIPAAAITAARPDCDHCTWVVAGRGLMRIKYVNHACPVHGRVECET